MVRLSSIAGTWTAEMNSYCIRESTTGQTITLGDEVMIVISKVDVERKNIDATLIRI